MTGTAFYRLASRGLPLLPFALNVRIQRLGRMPRPPGVLLVGQEVETRTAAGVPLTCLRPSLADRGVLVYVHGGSYVRSEEHTSEPPVTPISRMPSSA